MTDTMNPLEKFTFLRACLGPPSIPPFVSRVSGSFSWPRGADDLDMMAMLIALAHGGFHWCPSRFYDLEQSFTFWQPELPA